jgi:hypothetical protein
MGTDLTDIVSLQRYCAKLRVIMDDKFVHEYTVKISVHDLDPLFNLHFHVRICFYCLDICTSNVRSLHAQNLFQSIIILIRSLTELGKSLYKIRNFETIRAA